MSITRRNNKKAVEEAPQEEAEQASKPSIIMLPSLDDVGGIQSIGLYGDISEEKGSEIVYALLSLWNQTRNAKSDDTKKSKKDRPEPIELYVSTHGGSASDMFAIYDVMRQVKKDIDISTVGIGKALS